MIFFNSWVSPELLIKIRTSFFVILPRSPWLASEGCTKCEGVPVEDKVAAILLAIWPLFPIPVTITLPLILNNIEQTFTLLWFLETNAPTSNEWNCNGDSYTVAEFGQPFIASNGVCVTGY